MAGISLGKIGTGAIKSLLKGTSSAGNSLQRLATGLRVNSADGANSSLIGNRTVENLILGQSIRNINDSIGVVNTAQDAVTKLSAIVTRQKELTTLVSKGGLSRDQITALQSEANALVDEYNRTVSLASGSDSSISIQIGSSASSSFSLSLSNQISFSTIGISTSTQTVTGGAASSSLSLSGVSQTTEALGTSTSSTQSLTGGSETTQGVQGTQTTDTSITAGDSTAASGVTGTTSSTQSLTGGTETTQGVSGETQTSDSVTAGSTTATQDVTGAGSSTQGVDSGGPTTQALVGDSSTTQAVTGGTSTATGVQGQVETTQILTGSGSSTQGASGETQATNNLTAGTTSSNQNLTGASSTTQDTTGGGSSAAEVTVISLPGSTTYDPIYHEESTFDITGFDLFNNNYASYGGETLSFSVADGSGGETTYTLDFTGYTDIGNGIIGVTLNADWNGTDWTESAAGIAQDIVNAINGAGIAASASIDGGYGAAFTIANNNAGDVTDASAQLIRPNGGFPTGPEAVNPSIDQGGSQWTYHPPGGYIAFSTTGGNYYAYVGISDPGLGGRTGYDLTPYISGAYASSTNDTDAAAYLAAGLQSLKFDQGLAFTATAVGNTVVITNTATGSVTDASVSAGFSVDSITQGSSGGGAAFNATTNTATLASHGLATGQRVELTTAGSLPTGLSQSTAYYAIVDDSNTIRFATSRANALAGTAIDFSGTESGTVTVRKYSGDVDSASNQLTATSHGLTTGQRVQVSTGGSLPNGLAAATDYYAIVDDSNRIRLASSYSNALAGTAIDLTTDGSGDITLTKYTSPSFNRDSDSVALSSHGLSTGQRIQFSGAGVPTGLTAGVDYYAIATDGNNFKIASSYANAIGGTAINFTSDGSGTVTLTKITHESDFSVSGDTLSLSSHGLTTGQRIELSTSGSLPTGLSPGTAYYAIVTDSNTIKFATSKANAIAGTAVNLTSVGSGSVTVTKYTGDVDSAANTLTATSHGLVTGQRVQVSTAGSLPGGLSGSTDYYAIVDDANTIRLATSYANAIGNTAIDLSSNGSGNITLTKITHESDFNVGANTLTATSHGLATGQRVQLTGSGTAATGLSKSTDYYAIVDDANTVRFATSYANAIGGTAIDITGTGSGSLTLTGYTASDFDGTANTLTATTHGLATGQRVQLTGTGTAPTGLSKGTDYYAIVDDGNTVGFATSYANAIAGTRIDFGTDGSGSFTLSKFTEGNFDNTTDTVTATGHGLTTGQKVILSGSGTAPTGLSKDTDYYAIVVDANTIKLATSQANALAETSINFTSDGSGSFTLSKYDGTLSTQSLGALTTGSLTISAASFNTSTEQISSTAHGLTTGQAVQLSTAGSLAGGLQQGTLYYAIVDNANTIRLASSYSNALSSTAVDLTSVGSGNATLTSFSVDPTTQLVVGSTAGSGSITGTSSSSQSLSAGESVTGTQHLVVGSGDAWNPQEVSVYSSQQAIASNPESAEFGFAGSGGSGAAESYNIVFDDADGTDYGYGVVARIFVAQSGGGEIEYDIVFNGNTNPYGGVTIDGGSTYWFTTSNDIANQVQEALVNAGVAVSTNVSSNTLEITNQYGGDVTDAQAGWGGDISTSTTSQGSGGFYTAPTGYVTFWTFAGQYYAYRGIADPSLSGTGINIDSYLASINPSFDFGDAYNDTDSAALFRDALNAAASDLGIDITATSSGSSLYITNNSGGNLPDATASGFSLVSVTDGGSGGFNDTFNSVGLSSHGLSTGDKVTISGSGTAPTGLSKGTTYYAIRLDENTIQFAATYADAIAETEIDISDVGSGSLAINKYSSGFNAGTNQLTVASHGYTTGDAVALYGSSSAPTGLSTYTKYFAIVDDSNTIRLASSLANAIAGTAIDFSGSGGPDITVNKYATTNLGGVENQLFRVTGSGSGASINFSFSTTTQTYTQADFSIDISGGGTNAQIADTIVDAINAYASTHGNTFAAYKSVLGYFQVFNTGVGDAINATASGDVDLIEANTSDGFSAGTDAFNSTTDTITATAHGLATGQKVRLTGSPYPTDLPTGLSADTDYYAIVIDANHIQLASSYGNAIAETEINFSSDGSASVTLQKYSSSSSFNGATNQATATSHGLVTGQRVQLSGSGTAPTGLSKGVDYYAIVDDSNTIKFATSYANALANTSIDFSADGSGSLDLTKYVDGSINAGADTATISSHGFVTGQRIQLSGAGTAAGGLAKTTDYYAIVVDSNTIKFATSVTNAFNGSAINLTDGGSGSLTVTSYAGNFDATANSLTATSHGLTTGQQVTLSGTGSAPTSLSKDTVYYAIATDSNTIKFATSYANALAGTAVDFTGNGSGTYVLTKRSESDFDAASDTVTAAAHGLATGQLIQISGSGSAPAGLSEDTNYYAIVTGTNTFKFAASAEDATNGIAIDFTTNGSGALTLIKNTGGEGGSGGFDATANSVTVTGHGLVDGQRIKFSGGSVPTGLTADVDYYAIVDDANTFRVATTRANALAETAIDFSGSSTGSITLTKYTGAIDSTANTFTATAHGLATGSRIQLSTSGSLGSGLSSATDYYAIVVDANTIRIASSYSNALSSTAIDFTTDGSGDVTITKITPTSFNKDTDSVLQTSHGLATGQRIQFSGAGTPAGLTAGVDYYAIVTDANNFKIASSYANAISETAVDLTSDGSGSVTLTKITHESDFNATANTLAAASHGLTTGTRVRFTGAGVLPTGLAADTDYYVIATDGNTLKFATSRANALSATAIDISGVGSGSVTLTAYKGDIDSSANQIIASSHGLTTGQRVHISTTGTLAGGLSSSNDYYAIVDDTNTVRLATSKANALAGTSIDLTTDGTGNVTFTKYSGDIDSYANTLTLSSHGYATGQRVQLSTAGGLPSGFSAATDYYAIVVDSNTIRLASSYANAFAATAVDFSSDGTGDLTVTAYTPNAINKDTDTVTQTSHGLTTGQRIQFSGAGTAPTGVTPGADYYAVVIDANTFKIASSYANAIAESAIDLSSDGAGSLTLTKVTRESDFNATANSLSASTHNIATGTRVRFTGAGSTPTGLSLDTDYYAIATDGNTLKFATSRANALAGTAIDITSVGAGDVTLTAYKGDIDSSTNQILASSHGLATGQRVHVSTTGSLAGGLSSSSDYYVIVDDANTVRLASTKADALAGIGAVDLTSDGTGNVTLTKYTGPFDSQANTISATSHGLVAGQKIRLSSTGALGSGLSASTDYYAIVDDSNTIRLATSYANAIAETAIDFGTDGTGNSTLIIPGAGSFDAATNTVTSEGHGLTNGQRIRISSAGELAGGLEQSTDYYVIYEDDDHFKLATSLANALADVEIDFTSSGWSGLTTVTSYGASNFNSSNDSLSLTSHGLTNGQRVQLSSTGSLPTGLTAGVNYYAIVVDSNTIKFATSEAEATAGNAINLTSNGAGSGTLTAFTTTTTTSTGGTQNYFDFSSALGIASAVETLASIEISVQGQSSLIESYQTGLTSTVNQLSASRSTAPTKFSTVFDLQNAEQSVRNLRQLIANSPTLAASAHNLKPNAVARLLK